MRWPRAEAPDELIEKNTVQAIAISNSARSLNQGRLITAKDLQMSNDDELCVLGRCLDRQIGEIGRSYPIHPIYLAHVALGTKQRFGGSDPYQENDSTSLDYIYTSKLLLNTHKTV